MVRTGGDAVVEGQIRQCAAGSSKALAAGGKSRCWPDYKDVGFSKSDLCFV